MRDERLSVGHGALVFAAANCITSITCLRYRVLARTGNAQKGYLLGYQRLGAQVT
jgi:hypothetical protein